MARCIYHPQNSAIEECESCHVPLCGQCLWYAESGERLCQRCAQVWQNAGHTVLPPEQFAEGIAPTLDASTPAPQEAPGIYRVNNIDLLAIAAACLGGMIALSCIPCMGTFVPLLGLILGLIALIEAERSVNPGRTRTLAGVGIAGGALVVLGAFLWIAFSFFLPLLIFITDSLSKGP